MDEPLQPPGVASATVPRRPYPHTPTPGLSVAILCLVLNVFFLPGLGTVVGATAANERGVTRGVAQFLLSILIVGWVWGIVTGAQMVSNAGFERRQVAVAS